MHIVAEFDGVKFTEERVRRLLSAGVYIVPVEEHSQRKGNHENQVILGYAGLERASLLQGLDLIKADLQYNSAPPGAQGCGISKKRPEC